MTIFTQSQLRLLQKEGLDPNKKKKIPRHRLAEMFLYLHGEPLSLDGYEYLQPYYNEDPMIMVYKCGRQVAKTTTAATRSVMTCASLKNYKILYVNPLEMQAYRFSNLYVKPLMLKSPLIKRMINKDDIKSVMCRTFENGSMINFTYTSTTSTNTERFRGIPSDENIYDEYQDIPQDMIEILDQCLSASIMYGYTKITGTPKTMENPLETSWAMSSQNVWAMPCSCGTENVPVLPEVWEMIGPNGPICRKCQNPINPRNGHWLSLNPAQRGTIEGIHVPQIIVPFILTPERWARLYHQFLKYPRFRFANEVLGLSFDTGGRLITLTDLVRLQVLDRSDWKYNKARYRTVTAGIDWSGGGSSDTSYTTLTILGMLPNGRFESIFNKRFIEKDPLEVIPQIVKILNEWRVDFCAGDWGMGHTNNKLVRKMWCPHDISRFVEFQYASQKDLISWNKKVHRYILNKSYSMNLFYIDLKEKKYSFFKGQEVREVVFADFLSPFEEVVQTPQGGERKVFKRLATVPDDLTHSHNFAAIIAKRASGKLLVSYVDDDPEGTY